MPDDNERERLLAELRDAEERFRMFFERSAAGMNIADEHGRFLRVNQTFCDFLGYTPEELTQLTYLDIVHPEERAAAKRNLAEQRKADVTRRYVRKDGRTVWGFLSAVRYQEEPRHWIAVIQDTTIQKHAEEVLRERWELFRAVADDTPAYLWMAAAHPPYENTFINRRLAEFLGSDAEKLGNSWAEHLHPADREGVAARLVDAMANGRAYTEEFRLRRSDGEYRWMIGDARPRRSGAGEIIGYAGSLVDITIRKQAEEHIHRLSDRLIRVQEDQSSRIARELHDNLGQQIATLGLLVGNLKREGELSAPAIKRIDIIHAKLSDLAATIRGLSRQLHPASLEHAGLATALRTLAREFELATGIALHCACDESFREISSFSALCLFRVAQEAVQNIARHAQVREAEIHLMRSGDMVQLAIADRGRGFDVEKLTQEASGLGLISMRERVRLAGGTLTITSAAGIGTEVKASVPLRCDAASGATLAAHI